LWERQNLGQIYSGKKVNDLGKNQWVSPRGEKWAVHGENNERDTKVFDTQREAADYARDIAKNQQSEVIIQRPDGRIRSKDSYGNDLESIKDTEH
jgi:hypothetical protein